MKITITYNVEEADNTYRAIDEIAETFDTDAPENIFGERKIDCGAVKLDQKIGEIVLDVDSDFTVWLMGKVVGMAKAFKPFVHFVTGFIDGISDWIHPANKIPEEVNNTENDSESLPMMKEFDV